MNSTVQHFLLLDLSSSINVRGRSPSIALPVGTGHLSCKMMIGVFTCTAGPKKARLQTQEIGLSKAGPKRPILESGPSVQAVHHLLCGMPLVKARALSVTSQSAKCTSLARSTRSSCPSNFTNIGSWGITAVLFRSSAATQCSTADSGLTSSVVTHMN
jgi:hypothetical protein